MKANGLILGMMAALGVLLGGCASLPQAAPQLSAEIGKQILDARTAHLALVHRYMQAKRDRIDEFIAQMWIPTFAKDVFAQPAVKKTWDKIVQSGNASERLDFIVGMGTRLQTRINAKRVELMQPIDTAENLLVTRLNEHYDLMLSENSTLTAFLDSARSVKQRQQLVLSQMKVDGKLAGYMDKADEIVNKIVAGKNAYEQNKDKIQGILNQLRKGLGGG